jgi:hypothetical protein
MQAWDTNSALQWRRSGASAFAVSSVGLCPPVLPSGRRAWGRVRRVHRSLTEARRNTEQTRGTHGRRQTEAKEEMPDPAVVVS